MLHIQLYIYECSDVHCSPCCLGVVIARLEVVGVFGNDMVRKSG